MERYLWFLSSRNFLNNYFTAVDCIRTNYHGSLDGAPGAVPQVSWDGAAETQAPGSVADAFKDTPPTSLSPVLSAACASGSGRGHLLTPCPTARLSAQ